MASFGMTASVSAPVGRKMSVQLRAPARAVLAARPVRAARSVSFAAVAKATTDTVDKVRGIIGEQLGLDMDKVTAASKFVDLGADSLDTVEIMMALEEQFEITLDEEGAEKITTVQEAADLIQSQLK